MSRDPSAPVVEVVDSASDAFLRDMVEIERFTGVALVMARGEVVHAKGYGNATGTTPNTVETAMHVASVTKQFTAAAVLQLVETGALGLDQSINESLPPEYRSPKWARLSIHHLLSHTGGVPDYAVTRDYYDVVEGFAFDDTVDGMVREAMGKDLEFEPGSRFSYSNIGYTLLGLAIEHETGVPFGEYLQRNVLDPLGMTSSRVHVSGHVPATNEARGYRWSEEELTHVPDDVVSLPVTPPDGGLVTTLADFVRWTGVYASGGAPILRPESIERMTSAVIALPSGDSDRRDARGIPQGYGYGLSVSDGTISHPGYIVGFRSHFVLDRDEEILIAVFTNNTANDPTRISGGLLALVETGSPRRE